MVRFKDTTFYFFFLILLFLFSPSQAWTKSRLTVVFLDVGEGDAIYLETPTNENILIDTGNTMTGFRVADFLKDRGIESLDALFVTHPHSDHMGGIFHILPRFNVEAIYDNGQPILEPDCDIYRWYKEATKNDNYNPVATGDIFQYGDMKIQVLWPKSPTSSDWNANSLALKVSYGEIAFLFMGDATADVEKSLLAEGVNLKATILKVGHHGAIDTTHKEFLDAVSPTYAVISVNDDNIRDYPDVEVLKRLQYKKIITLLTYRNGDISFTIDRDGKLQLSISKGIF